MSFSVSKTYQSKLMNQQFFAQHHQQQQQQQQQISLQTSESEEKTNTQSQPQRQLASTYRLPTATYGGSRIQVNSQYVNDMY